MSMLPMLDNRKEYQAKLLGHDNGFEVMWFESLKKENQFLKYFELYKKWCKNNSGSILFSVFLILLGVIVMFVEINTQTSAKNEQLTYQLDIENEKIKVVISNLEDIYPHLGSGVHEIITLIKKGTVNSEKLIRPLMNEHIEIIIELHGLKNYKLRFSDMIFPMHENSYVGCPEAEFGVRKLKTEKYKTFHKGLDIYNPYNDEIIACSDGMVVRVGESKKHGKFILQRIFIDRRFYFVYYGHLDMIEVEKNQIVRQGQRIGLIGETGIECQGVHLHWQINKYHEFVDNTGKKRYRHEVINPVINTTWYGKKLESSRMI